MSISRVTHTMMSRGSLEGLQTALSRLARVQEQLSTGRVLNRPSDSPTDATSAMRMRSSIADQRQYARNGEDALGWLGQVDATLMGMTGPLQRARELGLRGANVGAMSAESRVALATEIDQLREGLIAQANTTYLERPVFGGVTPGAVAYDASGTWVGVPGDVSRTIADGVRIPANLDGPVVFGPPGDSLFDQLQALSTALRAGDSAGTTAALGGLEAAQQRVITALAEVGARYGRVERAVQKARDSELDLTSGLSEIENTDLPRALVELQLQETAYQAALASTARVMQPSLIDFLR